MSKVWWISLAALFVFACSDDETTENNANNSNNSNNASNNANNSNNATNNSNNATNNSNNATNNSNNATNNSNNATNNSNNATNNSNNGAVPTCEDYCAAYETACADQFVTDYTDNAGCLADCAAFAVGETTDTMGDTLGCRIYHTTAAVADPTTHCPHAGETPDAMCVDAM
jgi:DNA mismatch repair ATPase MutL